MAVALETSAGSGRAPGLIRAQIREAALYREAVSMGLDQHDPVARHMLVQELESIARDLVELSQAPTDQGCRYSLPRRFPVVPHRVDLYTVLGRGLTARSCPHQAPPLSVEQRIVPSVELAEIGSPTSSTGRRPPVHGNIVVTASLVISAFAQDPVEVLEERAKLVAQPPIAGDFMGAAVAIDGHTALVGVPDHDGGAWLSGAVHVFRRAAVTWQLEAVLVQDDPHIADLFGWSVDVQGDTALIGARSDAGTLSDLGGAYLFERDGSSWSQVLLLEPPGLLGDDFFGNSVAIDGETLVVGAPSTFSTGARGKAYVFERVGGTWQPAALLVARNGEPGDEFGYSVDLLGDWIAVGARYRDGIGPDSGSVYLFERSGASWEERTELVAADVGVGDEFGSRVALAPEHLVVGARGHEHLGVIDTGGVWVFRRTGETWFEEAELVPQGAGQGDQVGTSVATDGRTVLAGAPTAGPGAAYTFVRGEGGAWFQATKLVASDAQIADGFGRAVALGCDTALVGAPGSDVGLLDTGAAYVYSVPHGWVTSTCLAEPNSSGEAARIAARGSVSVAADELTLEASGCPPLEPALFFYGRETNPIPFGPGWLCASPFHPGLIRLLPIVTTDAGGAAARPLELAGLPPGGPIEPGTSWVFQLWCRDPAAGGTRSALSDGVRVGFCD